MEIYIHHYSRKISLLLGAYTITKNEIKYNYIISIIVISYAWYFKIVSYSMVGSASQDLISTRLQFWELFLYIIEVEAQTKASSSEFAISVPIIFVLCTHKQ